MSGLRSDAELVRAYQKGDREAFTELDRRYRERLLRFLVHRGFCSGADAEDRVQQTLFRASERFGQLVNPERLAPWLFQMAARICIDEARKTVPQPISVFKTSNDPAYEPVSSEFSPDHDLIWNETKQNLWSSAENILTDDEYRFLWMFYAEELNLTDIVKMTGKTNGAVRTLLHRIRKKLARSIESADF